MSVFFAGVKTNSPKLENQEMPGPVQSEKPWPVASEYLASHHGYIYTVDTKTDPTSRGRQILTIVFSEQIKYPFYINTEAEAENAFKVIVDYMARYDYSRYVSYFQISYGRFHRYLRDLQAALERKRLSGSRGGPVGDTAGNTADELIAAAWKVPPEKHNIAIRLLQQLAERETTNRETAPLRTVPNTPQEIAELEQLITLARLRLLYQQKLEAIELPAGGFTNKKQADLANQLGTTYSRLRRLEKELGLLPTEKDKRVKEAEKWEGVYRRPKKPEEATPRAAAPNVANFG
jgi:hypothetical protein